MSRKLVVGFIGVALLLAFLFRLSTRQRPVNQMPAKLPEELVWVRSSDDVVSAGVRFTPPNNSSRPIAIRLGAWLGNQLLLPELFRDWAGARLAVASPQSPEITYA
jgi:hypothetical protein